MANKRTKVESGSGFIFLGCKITGNDDCSHEIKRQLLRSISHLLCLLHCGQIRYPWAVREALLGRKIMTNLSSALKSRDITLPTKVHIVKAIVFSSSHVWQWELFYKEERVLKNWCIQILVLEKSLENSNRSVLQEINLEYSFEGLMLKLKL